MHPSLVLARVRLLSLPLLRLLLLPLLLLPLLPLLSASSSRPRRLPVPGGCSSCLDHEPRPWHVPHQSTSNPKSISRLANRSRIAEAKLSMALAALFISFGCFASAHQGKQNHAGSGTASEMEAGDVARWKLTMQRGKLTMQDKCHHF